MSTSKNTGGPSNSGDKSKERKGCLDCEDYFMAVAVLTSQRSKDPNTQVGACIVNQENNIVGIGYNSMPKGCDEDKMPWAGSAGDKLDTKYPYVCYAVMNAIMNKNSANVSGCSIYATLFPSNECAKLIIQSGIKEVIYLSYRYKNTVQMEASKKLLDMAEVKYRLFTPKQNRIVIDLTPKSTSRLESGSANEELPSTK
ncbi:deoxycytidylate deaminase-like isoform X2 [Hoplias malabaricus]|uniref:deoxycytidylate deaminase-like isoform X2 n=1 Tax=Hoplias malabaricus TaxID=27720 RepID=UPI00346288A3